MSRIDLYDKLQVLEREGEEILPIDRVKAAGRPLLSWYDEHKRELPWRSDPQPYRVWISEIMLQQTRVEAVKPYFDRFMKELPDVRSLAHVPEERLLKLWEGLGYYNRARNLKKAAQEMEEHYQSQLPADYEALLSLPGIGSYTAGAIASIAYGIPVPAVDGNVLRVMSRLLASTKDIAKQAVKKEMEQLLLESMNRERAGDFNQALIETGAIVCIPNGEPKCTECPLSSLCLARKRGLTDEIPVKAPKKERRIEQRTVLILEYQDRIAIRKREKTGLLASLYELPNLEGYLDIPEVCAALGLFQEDLADCGKLPSAKHIFSHVEWRMEGLRMVLAAEPPSGFIWVSKKDLSEKYPLPNAFRAYMRLIK